MTAYTDAVERGLRGLRAVSTGICSGCETCQRETGMNEDELRTAWESGTVCDEPFFSWSSCDVCGSSLGGNREPGHGLDDNGDIVHLDGVCVDCVCYLANGDEPEEWDE